MDVDRLLSRATDALSVGRAFGPPVERDGILIIPVAWVAGGGGAGIGTDRPSTPDGDGSDREGSGTGFGVVSWPLGVYVVKDGDVRWVPAIDATRIALAGFAVVRALTRGRRRRTRS